jgi:hypothetical protein
MEQWSEDDLKALDLVADVVREELAACVGARRLESPDGVEVTADLIAHAVVRSFDVREREVVLKPYRRALVPQKHRPIGQNHRPRRITLPFVPRGQG